MRTQFPWAAGLADTEFARALLLVGLLPPSLAWLAKLPARPELEKLLVERWEAQRDLAWPWRLRPGSLGFIGSEHDARSLIEASHALYSRAMQDWADDGRGLRIEVNVSPGIDPRELAATLHSGGAHSTCARLRTRGDLTWSWPLQIAAPRQSGWLETLPEHNPLVRLFELHELESVLVRCDLLIVPGPPRRALESLTRDGRARSADVVVILDETDDYAPSDWPLFEGIRSAVDAQGIFLLSNLKPHQGLGTCAGLVAYLSHDHPIDTAVARVALENQAGSFSWASRELLTSSSVREQGRRLAQRLLWQPTTRLRLDPGILDKFVAIEPEPHRGSGRARGPRRTFGTKSGTPGGSELSEKLATWLKAGELGAALERRIEMGESDDVPHAGMRADFQPLKFRHESDGAGELADLARAFATQGADRDDLQDVRYLQARIETAEGRVINGPAPMRPSRELAACVFIGQRNPEWLGLGEPIQTPNSPDGSPTILDVLFWEPTVSPQPQITRIELRSRGDSTMARFPFRTPEHSMRFSARIGVYHRNRNLQTGRLIGQVGDGPAELRFVPDAAPVPRFEGLADRPGVSASIVVNHPSAGRHVAFVYSDGQATVTDLSSPTPSVAVNPSDKSLAALTATLGRAITAITQDPEAYADLEKEGTRTLLRDLAQHGSALRNWLVKHTPAGSTFEQAEYVQIVSADVDAFFPAEYLYNGKPPEDDARVCDGASGAANAIGSGHCCGAYDKNPGKTICPLRFWCLGKVIERHAHLPEHNESGARFVLRSAAVSARDRELRPLRTAVLGVSDNVDKAVPNTVKQLRTELDTIVGGSPSPLATDWKSWKELIESSSPELLVLLPHHLQEGTFDLLEIGGDKLKSVHIEREYVRATTDESARPIVLLIGCQTGAAKIDLEGFVPFLQDAGAAIVVSTISSILGRHAGPAAAAIARELKRQQSNPDGTFGRVMLEVRRRLLADGCPMVLGLTSYGDADWRIAPEPTTTD